MKVLIADDDRITRKLLKSHLTEWGHETIERSDGQEAWEVLQDEDAPQFAILDWMMPGIKGIDVCRMVRSQDKDFYRYVVLLTSRGGKEDIVEGLEAGADDYIVKPFEPNELKVRVRAGARILQLQSDLRMALNTSEYKASHDALTRVLNRGALLEALEREIVRSKRNNAPLGLIMADIDHFKRINDTYGHLAGDEALRVVAKSLTSLLRPYDYVGRYGGEEFIILAPGCDTNETKEIAERLRQSFDGREIGTSEGVLRITISFGVTSYLGSDTGPFPDLLIKSADEALYIAKTNGRNRVEVNEGRLLDSDHALKESTQAREHLN